MSKKFICYLLILAAFLILFSLFAFAQEEDTDLAEAIEIEEPEVVASDLEVDEPGTFFWLRDIFREIQIWVAFDPIKKSELHLKKASRQIIRVRKMIKENPDDEELQEKLAELDAKYQQLIERINQRIEDFKAENPDSPKLESFLDKYTEHQLLHQEILEKLEEEVPEKVFEIINRNRERHLERFGEVMNRLQEKEELKERLKEGLGDEDEVIEHQIRRLEIIEELGEKTPAVKEIIEEIKEERQELFQELKTLRQEIRENISEFREEAHRLIEELKDSPQARQELIEDIQEKKEQTIEENRGLIEDMRQELYRFREGVREELEGMKPEIEKPEVCIQVITPAKNPQTGECKEFPTPCQVPADWTKVSSCGDKVRWIY